MKSAKTATGCLLISFCTNFLVRTEQSSINGSVEEFSLKNAALHSTAGNVAEMVRRITKLCVYFIYAIPICNTRLKPPHSVSKLA